MLNWDLSRHCDSLEWCLLKILHWLANPGSLLASSHDNTGYDIYNLSWRANIDRDHVTKPRDCLTYRKFQNCDSVERIYYKIDFIRYSLPSLFITLGCLLFFPQPTFAATCHSVENSRDCSQNWQRLKTSSSNNSFWDSNHFSLGVRTLSYFDCKYP